MSDSKSSLIEQAPLSGAETAQVSPGARNRGYPLRTALIGLVAIPLLALIVSLAYDTYREYIRDANQAFQTASTIRAISAAQTEQFLANAKLVLSELARRPRVQSLNPNDCDPVLTELKSLQPAYANLLTLDAQGRLVCSAVGSTSGQRTGPDPRYYFAQVVRTRQFAVGKPAKGFVTGRWVSTLAYPILNGAGQLTGVVAIAVDLLNYQPMISQKSIPPLTVVGIVNSEGIIIARSSEAAQRVGVAIESEASRVMLTQRQGTTRARDYQGVKRFYAFAPITDSDWVTFVSLDEATVLAPVIRLAYERFAWVAALVLSVVAATALLARRIAKPVEGICRTMADVGRGAVQERAPVAGPTEFRQIATQFNTMLDQRLQAEKELRESEERSTMAQEGGQIGIWQLDVATRNTYWSPVCARLYGFDPGTLRDNDQWRKLVHPEDLILIDAQWDAKIARGESFEVEFRFHRNSGETVWILTKGRAQYDADGRPMRLFGINIDITARKQAEGELRLSASVFNNAREGITVTDIDGTILDVNDSFTRITGYGHDEAVGQNPRILKSGRQTREFYVTMWRDLLETGSWSGEIWNKRKNGEIYPALLTITAVRDDGGHYIQYVALFSDITLRKQVEDQVHQLAFFDPLTKLPNRRLLNDRLSQTMAASKRSACYGALMFLDLDNFKPLNDAHGHATGDLLLIEVAGRLISCVREVDTVARVGGDEFVVMLSELTPDRTESASQAKLIAEKIRSSLSEPYLLILNKTGKTESRVEHRCTASIGAVLFVDHEATQDDILKWADNAMYQAKAAGRNNAVFYEDLILNGSSGGN